MHVVVVGGGIAGLAAAWFLRASGELASRAMGAVGVRVTVLEGAARVGGKLALGEVAGLTLDVGAEALLARRLEALDLVRAVGLGDDLVHPRTTSAGVWTRGKIRPLPAAQVMGVPAAPGDGSLIGILSKAGAARVAGDLMLPLQKQSDVSVAAFVGQRMGTEVVQRLVDPLLGGVYAGRAEDLSMFATLPQLARAVSEPQPLMTVAADVRAKAATGTPVFAGIVGGVGRLPARLAEASGAEVRTGVVVRELRRTETGWRLTAGPTTDPELIDADAVVLAVPAPAAAKLLGEAVPVAAADLAGVEYASMAIVTLVFPAGEGVPALHGSGFVVPAIDGRTIKAVTQSSNKWEWTHRAAGGHTVLRASVGRMGDIGDLQLTDEELIAKVRADLSHSIGIYAHPIDARVTRWGGALPQYAVGHLERVDRVRAAVETVPGLAVCGAVYEGVGIAACIASAQRAVATLQNGVI
ncbi:MAG: protoporphyrinogen oxidase [Sporichthyaceae bacterium]